MGISRSAPHAGVVTCAFYWNWKREQGTCTSWGPGLRTVQLGEQHSLTFYTKWVSSAVTLLSFADLLEWSIFSMTSLNFSLHHWASEGLCGIVCDSAGIRGHRASYYLWNWLRAMHCICPLETGAHHLALNSRGLLAEAGLPRWPVIISQEGKSFGMKLHQMTLWIHSFRHRNPSIFFPSSRGCFESYCQAVVPATFLVHLSFFDDSWISNSQ